MLSSSEIIMQENSDTCAHVAVQNLLKLRGLPVPLVEDIDRAIAVLCGAQGVEPSPSPTPWELFGLLGSTPLLVSLVSIPTQHHAAPARVLTRFLDAGCHLLVFYTWRDFERGLLSNHVVVAESYDARGMVVLDGEGPFEGAVIELEPPALTDELKAEAICRREESPHGARRMLPFYPVTSEPHARAGLVLLFIAVWP